MKYKIQINGMTCRRCASNAETTLNALSGVSASVSFDTGLALVEAENSVSLELLFKAIESEGYHASLADNYKARNKSASESGLLVAIVGTGSAAFAAAIRAAENGAQVTMIEGADIIGGTCVNIGCVPSKIFIRGANIAHLQGHHNHQGIALNNPEINRKAMMLQQQEWVEKLRYAKYESILDSNPGISLVRGMARFKNNNTLLVTNRDGTQKNIEADRILLAVGARPLIPDITGLKETPFWTSTEALLAEQLPKHLVVLGASVVALELAQAFHHLGSKVTILARSTILSNQDHKIGETLKLIFEEEGINVLLDTVATEITYKHNTFTLMTPQHQIKCDQLLVATGRQSNADSLGLETIGIKTTNHGAIKIDDHMRTSVANIYAAGDCTDQAQFVYVAAAAGTRAARNMTGDNVALDLSVLPTVVFTEPQVATVGLSEQQAQQQGIPVQSSTLDLKHVPRAIANFDTRGFIKLVAETDSGQIIGCQIVSAEAGEIIQTAALAISNKMTIDTLAEQLFPYLTMVEGLKLAAQTFNKDVTQLSCCAG